MQHLLASPARLAAVLLLLVWVGPVTFAQTDTWRVLRWVGAPKGAAAASQVIPAGMALLLEPGTPLKLRLRDGNVVSGRFLGRTLLDSALYAPRFAAYVRSAPSVPLTMGETLHVSLRDGREWTAPFAGYGELALLLRGPDWRQPLRAPFESTNEIWRANGNEVEPSALAEAFRSGRLPSAEALVMGVPPSSSIAEDRWADARRVPVEEIESVMLDQPSGAGVAGVVLLTVVASVVLLGILIGASEKSTNPSCGASASESYPPLFSGAHLTTRPFDRYRACYVGDERAVADPWPGPNEAATTTTFDDMAKLPGGPAEVAR